MPIASVPQRGSHGNSRPFFLEVDHRSKFLREAQIHFLVPRDHRALLQSFVDFLGAAERMLYVFADVLFANDLGEFRLMDQLRWLLACATENQGSLRGV